MSDLRVQIHREEEVSRTRMGTTRASLKEFDDYFDIDFAVSKGKEDFPPNMSTDVDSSARVNWITYVEDQLYQDGCLGDALLHVILYNHSEGAGFHNWTVGVYDAADGRPSYYKRYRRYWEVGYYAFAFVNVATGNWPYTKKWYKNTVKHEAGHTLNCTHNDGEITESGGNFHASPMCTWYVEQNCNAVGNPKPSSLCYDASGDMNACNHEGSPSSCTVTVVNEHTSKNL